MSEIERILLECRYLLSLDKTYLDIANYHKVSEKMVFNDLNYKLPKIDSILYHKVEGKLKKLTNM